MATVDVIIPAFNAAKYLPAALESVGAQTFEDWQIVLVDDGSTDNTAEVVAPFIDRFGPKLKYIKQENRGMSAARNAAIRASTSEWIALLDADDVWAPCRLAESIQAFATRPRAGIAYGLITYMDHAGRPLGTFQGNAGRVEGSIAPYIYMRKVELPCVTVTIRRACIDQVGLFDETMRSTEDRDLWLRIALHHEVASSPKSSPSIARLPAPFQPTRNACCKPSCNLFANITAPKAAACFPARYPGQEPTSSEPTLSKHKANHGLR
jgi:glycosyltransferase involved in cell wall biosynthesis